MVGALRHLLLVLLLDVQVTDQRLVRGLTDVDEVEPDPLPHGELELLDRERDVLHVDLDDPVHVALSHVALDAVALAEGAPKPRHAATSASTFLVAWTLGLLWLCNAAQIHELQAGGRSSSEDDDAPPAKSDGAISFSV